jgi:hypothetical protein
MPQTTITRPSRGSTERRQPRTRVVGTRAQYRNPLDVNLEQGWLAPALSTETPKPAGKFKGDVANSSWLPNKKVALAWQDFVKTGAVSDTSPPPAPTNVKVDKSTGNITWKAPTDFESGIQTFLIKRDGKLIGQIPEKPKNNRYGRQLFQGMSYGDTPVLPLLKFQFVDSTAEKGKPHNYQVIAVNTAGLHSK